MIPSAVCPIHDSRSADLVNESEKLWVFWCNGGHTFVVPK